MAMMEIRNVHKTFRTYAKAGLRLPELLLSVLPVLLLVPELLLLR